MNKLFLSLAFAGATFFAQDTFAQNKPSIEARKEAKDKGQHRVFDPVTSAEQVAKRMQLRYGLSDAQTVKVQAANLQFAQAVQALQSTENTNTSLLRATHDNAIKGILTAEQYAKFTEDITKSTQRVKGDRKPHQGKDKAHKGNAENKGKAYGKDNVKGKAEGKGQGKDNAKGKPQGKGKNGFDAEKAANRPLNVYRMLGEKGQRPNAEQKAVTPQSNKGDKMK